MISKILLALSVFVLKVINKIGYTGVFLLMLLESANIPIPSEVIMPFSGFLASSGRFNLFLLIFIGALGNLVGSLLSYGLAFLIGEPIEKFFRRIPFFEDDYLKAQKFFKKYGNLSVFWGRLLPIIRTFISFPAGVFKVPIWKFSFLTFIGSFLWSGLLAYIGFYLGGNWQRLEIYFRKFDYLIAVVISLLIFYYIFSKVKKHKINQNKT